MNEHLLELIKRLPDYLGGHIVLSLSALLVGLLISVPLGISASRHPKLGEVSLGCAGIIQTVPSLALLALMVLGLGGLIGFWPAFLALTLYSILPMLANTVVGIRGVDPTLIEAARGLGMNPRQMLFHVQLPLAAPVIIAGIRTATVLVIGTATLVSPVGGVSLGNYIFEGLESLNYLSTIFGCVLAALLAIVMDQLIHLLELAARRRSKTLAWTGGLGILAVMAGGFFGPVARLFESKTTRVVIGSAPFTEQHILSEVLTKKFRQDGLRADQRKSMSEGIQFMALKSGQIDCMVNYSGNVWSLLMKRKDFADRETVLREIERYFREQYGIVSLGSLGFQNAYALAMRREQAIHLGIHTISDLSLHAAKLKIASDNQFFDRPEWFKVRDEYQLAFKNKVSMDPSLMYGAVKDGQVDVITAYTSDGRIQAFDLLLLEDDRRAFPPYDAVLLLSAAAARRPEVAAALQPLIGSIPLETMQATNARVDVDGWLFRQAAAELLQKVAGSPPP